MSRLQIRLVWLGACVLGVLLCTTPSFAITETFSSFTTGEVIAGQLPGGGTASGTAIPFLTFSVTNTGGGPHSLIIFDSSNPTGGDPDLGTPNQDFGGPGIGNGGKSGAAGENNQSWGKLLIVAENLVDNNNDGYVDNPDDEEGGGAVQSIAFGDAIVVNYIVMVDIDANETASFECFYQGNPVGTKWALSLGDNSVQVVTLGSYGLIDQLIITLSGSGAIAEIDYDDVVKTEETTWGRVKALYQGN